MPVAALGYNRRVMQAFYIHRIDPVLYDAGGVYLWWYGLSYTLGFLNLHRWLRRNRRRLGMTLNEVYRLTLCFSVGVLIGGRCIEVIFYEWSYYQGHLPHIFFYWLGGMSTHGLLLGAVVGTMIFCRYTRRSFLPIADALVIPGAFILGVGRVGNFIDGQIAGGITDVWWAVQFPDMEGFRHPVVLYDGVKNLLLIPLLLWIRKRGAPAGVLLGHFVFWYGFLRIFIDLFREYRVDLFFLGPGQEFNILMSVLGLVLLVISYRKKWPANYTPIRPPERETAGLLYQKLVFVSLLVFSLTLPSDWTQDIPKRYGERHEGLRYSLLYPPIEAP